MGAIRKKPKFISITAKRSGNSAFPSNPLPAIKITKTPLLCMTPEVYKTMGSPEFMSAAYSPESELIKLQAHDQPGEGGHNRTGIRKVGYTAYKTAPEEDDDGYYYIILTHSRAQIPIFENLKRGYYTPIGGGLFKYHGASAPRR